MRSHVRYRRRDGSRWTERQRRARRRCRGPVRLVDLLRVGADVERRDGSGRVSAGQHADARCEGPARSSPTDLSRLPWRPRRSRRARLRRQSPKSSLPLFGKLAGKWVVVEAPHTFDPDTFADEGGNGGTQVRTENGGTQVRTEGGSTQVRTERRRPSFGITLFTVLLPVVLMLGKALVDIFIEDDTQWFRRI